MKPSPSPTGTSSQPAEAARTALDAIFRPQSVAVVGASRSADAVGAEVLRNLVACGFTGPVYPVNPNARSVQSMRAYPSVRAIPDQVDMAVIAVPGKHVPAAVDDCLARGIRGLVILSAGFAETGAQGLAVQAAMRDRVRAAGARMVGPNCLGVVNTEAGVRLNATFAPTWPPTGNVAIASQSGAVGLALLDDAQNYGIGISHFASMGNKADISGNDLLEYWEHDPGTRVILLYLESLGNTVRFMEIARRVSRSKPVLVVKSGRSLAGARAASSHTGAMAGSDVAVEAIMIQAGVIRTANIEELFGLAVMLDKQPVPAGRRVALLTNAGGPGIMAADAIEALGMQVASLSAETEAKLKSFLPAEASVRNPVDMLAMAQADTYQKSMGILLADAGVDALLAMFVPPMMTDAAAIAGAIRQAAAGSPKPVVANLLGRYGIDAAKSSLHEGGIPTYNFPEPAVAALAGAARYGEWLRRPVGVRVDLGGLDAAAAREAISAASGRAAEKRGEDGGFWLDTAGVSGVLTAYGIRMPRSVTTATARDAGDAAEEMGCPVAVKLVSSTITHKSEVGGVRLGLRGGPQVKAACDDMVGRLAALGRESECQGFLIQEMVAGGVETVLGIVRNPGYPPLVAFGIGGVAVEVWRDVVYRASPLTDQDAREMLKRLRGRALLEGFRGAPAADRGALVDAILRVDRMAGDLPEILEMDINPLVAMAEGGGVVAVDARIRVRQVP